LQNPLIAINSSNFPDKAFRKYIKSNFDDNNDGKLDHYKTTKTINIPKKYKVKNLKGIEYFTNLKSLTVNNGKLKTVNLKKNRKLRYSEDFDLVVVPCCTCTPDGRRLGFGGGFYDRWLARTGAVRVIMCRDENHAG